MKVVSTELGRISGNKEEHRKTDRNSGHSNFLYVGSFLEKHGALPYSTQLLRIFSLARKLNFQSVLVDEIACGECPQLAEENTVLKLVDDKYSHSQVYKFSFFGKEGPSCPPVFLGYAVYKIDHYRGGRPFGHVYEAVLSPPRTKNENNFLHCKRRYLVANSSGSDYHVTGALYAQQNGKTFVCAHVALRTALSCLLPEGDISYSAIRTMAGSGKGLEPEQIERVFQNSGISLFFNKQAYEPKTRQCPTDQQPCPADHLLNNTIDYNKELYGFTESRVPSLLGFKLANGRRHIVPVLGHTFNEDSWVPSSNQNYFSNDFRFFSSEQWLSSHLIHDDNFGPYFCLPRHFLQKSDFRLLYGISYDKSSLFSSEAEAAALAFFHRARNLLLTHGFSSLWTELFIAFKDFLVLRAIFTSRESYLHHLRTGLESDVSNADEATVISAIEKLLPEKFWMVEASTIELFPVTRRKFGEVILAPSDPEDGVAWNSSFIMMRLPGCYFLRNRDGGEWIRQKSTVTGHTQVYSHPDT